MASVRSPSYPNISLKNAILRVGDLFEVERFNPISREAAAKLFGYSGLTGGSNTLLSDLTSYGLIERIGKGEVRVTQLTARIIHPNDANEYGESLLQAANSPKLFSTLRERFPDNLPSEGNLEGVLVRMGFSSKGTKPAKKSFLETYQYLEEEGVSESHGDEVEDGTESNLPEDNKVTGSASIGDLVQWESQGVLQFQTPQKVRWVSDDGTHLAVEGSDTGIPMEQVTVQSAVAPAPPQIPPMAPPSETPSAGQRKAVFPVSEGDVTFIFPKGMTLDGIEELEAYLAVFLKKEKRVATNE